MPDRVKVDSAARARKRAGSKEGPLSGRLLLLLFVISTLKVSKCVEILKLSVPSLVRYNMTSEVFLSCNFGHSHEEERQLEVKWYHNDEHSPFFQWLPGSDHPPQIIGDFFQDHLDATAPIDQDMNTEVEEVGNNDTESGEANQNHRLRLYNIVPELGGSYKCKVSSFIDEDFKQADMLVYSFPEKVEFKQSGSSAAEEVELTCAVRGIYPQPKIAVTWSDGDGTSHSRFEPMLTAPNPNDSSLFDCELNFKLNQSRLLSQTNFTCEVELPDTEKSMAVSALYPQKVDVNGTEDDAPTAAAEESSFSPSNSSEALSSSANGIPSYCPAISTYIILFASAASPMLHV